MQSSQNTNHTHYNSNIQRKTASYTPLYVPYYQSISNATRTTLNTDSSSTSLRYQTSYQKYRQQFNTKINESQSTAIPGYQYSNQATTKPNYEPGLYSCTPNLTGSIQNVKNTEQQAFKKKVPLNSYGPESNRTVTHVQNRLASSQVTIGSSYVSSNFIENNHFCQTAVEKQFKGQSNNQQNRYNFLSANSYKSKPYQYMTIKKAQNQYPNVANAISVSRDSSPSPNLNSLRATIGSPSQKKSSLQQKQKIQRQYFTKKEHNTSIQSITSFSKNEKDPEIQRPNAKTLRQSLKKQVGQLLYNKAGISSMKSIPILQYNTMSKQTNVQSQQSLGIDAPETDGYKMKQLRRQLSTSRNFNDALQTKLTKTEEMNKQLKAKLQQLNKRLCQKNKNNNQVQQISVGSLRAQNKQLKAKLDQLSFQKQTLNQIICEQQQKDKSTDQKYDQQLKTIKARLRQFDQSNYLLQKQVSIENSITNQIRRNYSILNTRYDQRDLQLVNTKKQLQNKTIDQKKIKEQVNNLQKIIQKLQREVQQGGKYKIDTQIQQITSKNTLMDQSYQANHIQQQYLQIIKQKEAIFQSKIRKLQARINQSEMQKQNIKTKYQNYQQNVKNCYEAKIMKILEQNQRLKGQISKNSEQRKQYQGQIKQIQSKQQVKQDYWQSFINGQLVLQRYVSNGYRPLIRIPIKEQILGEKAQQDIQRRQIAFKDVLDIVVSQCLNLGLKLMRSQSSEREFTNKDTQANDSKVSENSQGISKSAVEQENMFFLQKQIIELKSELQKKNLVLLEKEQQNHNLSQCLVQLKDQLDSYTNSASPNHNHSFDEQLKNIQQKLNVSLNQESSQNSNKKARKLLQRDKDKIRNSRNRVLNRNFDQIEIDQGQQSSGKKQDNYQSKFLMQSRSKKFFSYKSVRNLGKEEDENNKDQTIKQKSIQILSLKSKIQSLQKLNNSLQQQVDIKHNRQAIQSNFQFYQLVFECYSEILEIFNIDWQADESQQLSKPPHQDLLQAINGFTKRIQNLMQSLNTMSSQVSVLTEENETIKDEQNHILKKCQFMISNAEAENDELVSKIQNAYRKLQHAHAIIITLEKILRDSNEQVCALNLKLLNLKINPTNQVINKKDGLPQEPQQYIIIAVTKDQINKNEQNFEQEQLSFNDRNESYEIIQKQINLSQEFSLNNPLSPASGQISYRTQTAVTKKDLYPIKKRQKNEPSNDLYQYFRSLI